MGTFLNLLSGAITQSGLLSSYTQMAIGSGMVGAGLLLMFPSPRQHWFYTNVPYIAYPAVVLSGQCFLNSQVNDKLLRITVM